MFRCQQCGRCSAPGEKSCERILELRRQEYPLRIKAHAVRRPSPKGVSRTKLLDDPGGIGTAVMRRIVVCAACAQTVDNSTTQVALQATCRVENVKYQAEMRRSLEEERRRKSGRHRDDDD